MSTTLDKYDDDEYVAKLLAEDAKKSSTRYASVGLSALIPRRSGGGSSTAPKPNTRFLRNLVREADSHNAALKKKEEIEARIRLRGVRDRERRQGQEEGDEKSERTSKRRRLDVGSNEDREDDDRRHKKRSDARRRRRRRSRSPRSGQEEDTDGRDRRRYRRDVQSSQRRLRSRSSEDEDRRRRRQKHKHDDSSSDDTHRRRHRRGESDAHTDSERRYRHNHRRSHHSSSRYGKTDTIRQGSQSPEQSSKHRPSKSRPDIRGSQNSASDSDPLEAHFKTVSRSTSHRSSEMKPSAPTTTRGRGFLNPTKSTSNIDLHFSNKYDPALDIHPDSPPHFMPDNRSSLYGRSTKADGDDDMDWDMALEALRDRAMWKRKQADRLREAGWDEKQIQKWETKSALGPGGGDTREGDMSSVTWSKRGEQREWDRGKDLDLNSNQR